MPRGRHHSHILKQVYADWWYAWCLLYFIGPRGIHKDIFITLKKSLRWVPIVGWVSTILVPVLLVPSDYSLYSGNAVLQLHLPCAFLGGRLENGEMHFPSVSPHLPWQQLASSLSTIGKEAEKDGNPFAFILYPEGTLVSKDTRPISRKFAEKTGIVSPGHALNTALELETSERHEEHASSKIYRPSFCLEIARTAHS